MAEKNVRAMMIVEIMGRPANYLAESFRGYLDQIKSDKRIEVVAERVFEPKKIEGKVTHPGLKEADDMYTAFAEIEIKTSSFQMLIDLIFDYMPSSVELIEPQEVSFNTSEATSFFNSLAGRLHKYDEIAKMAQIQGQQLAAQFYELKKQIDSQKVIQIEDKSDVKTIETKKEAENKEEKPKKSKKKLP